jgi:hypothetical protein
LRVLDADLHRAGDADLAQIELAQVRNEGPA